MANDVSTSQHPVEIFGVTQVTLADLTLKFRDKPSTIAAGCDNMQVFVTDLVQLDYELQPKLWVECGECSVTKLNRLAVKAHEADIWVIKKSLAEAEELYDAMAKQKLRRGRYNLIGLDQDMFQEMIDLMGERNQLNWYKGSFDPSFLQVDFNDLWFDATFKVLKF